MAPVGASAQGVRAGGFRPDQISTLEHWYDATKLSGFSDGNSVGTWPDEEGTDDLTQGTGSKQPTYQADVLNGKPIVRHDGADDILNAAWADITQPYWIFMACQFVSVSSSNEVAFDGADNTEAQFRTDSTSPTNWEQVVGGSTGNTGSAADTNPHVVSFLGNGSSSLFRIDAVQDASGNGNTDALQGLTVGTNVNETAPAAVDVGELLIYSADLSTSDRDSVETYLADKWSIAI